MVLGKKVYSCCRLTNDDDEIDYYLFSNGPSRRVQTGVLFFAHWSSGPSALFCLSSPHYLLWWVNHLIRHNTSVSSLFFICECFCEFIWCLSFMCFSVTWNHFVSFYCCNMSQNNLFFVREDLFIRVWTFDLLINKYVYKWTLCLILCMKVKYTHKIDHSNTQLVTHTCIFIQFLPKMDLNPLLSRYYKFKSIIITLTVIKWC